VPDTAGTVSCAHGVGEVGLDVPGTFLHELQHLINYSQHVVVSGGAASSSWMDEGMSIVAEELGSVYYEKKYPCPGVQCPAPQLFPDSSQGFIQDVLYDSYEYVLLPDTATITLSTDDEKRLRLARRRVALLGAGSATRWVVTFTSSLRRVRPTRSAMCSK